MKLRLWRCIRITLAGIKTSELKSGLMCTKVWFGLVSLALTEYFQISIYPSKWAEYSMANRNWTGDISLEKGPWHYLIPKQSLGAHSESWDFSSEYAFTVKKALAFNQALLLLLSVKRRWNEQIIRTDPAFRLQHVLGSFASVTAEFMTIRFQILVYLSVIIRIK